MRQYLNLLETVLSVGKERPDRTGVGVRSIFGYQMRFSLDDGFPILTTKQISFRAVAAELAWFLRGETNVKSLHKLGARFWDPWAKDNGELGPIYGHQWRNFGASRNVDGSYNDDGVDQILQVVDEIKNNPYSRRLVVSAWNPKDIPFMALPPCHLLFQFYVDDNKLSCLLYQRSADIFIGVPFNIASYSLLVHLIAHICNLNVGEFVHMIGDAHLYLNHIEAAEEQLKRRPRVLPRLLLDSNINDLITWDPKQVSLIGYNPYPRIKVPVAV